MSSSTNSLRGKTSTKKAISKNSHIFTLKFSSKNERRIFKTFLLERLHYLFSELFQKTNRQNQNNLSMECYTMDSQIIRFLIQDIVATEEYTLEGIAFHTRIPFDVILDAACGKCNNFSITLWARIASLYFQVKPEITKVFFAKLLEMKEMNYSAMLLLLNETY